MKNLLIAVAVLGLPASAAARTLPPQSIYFEPGSAIPDRERGIEVIRAAMIEGPGYVGAGTIYIMQGHTDRAGTAEANVRLSNARAQAVRALMLEQGIPASRIRVQGFGESRPAMETRDEVAEPRNRRVEIAYRPPN